ncbi:AfsR/SARP family transcriptional regulator [Nocardiopsis coralliicola]
MRYSILGPVAVTDDSGAPVAVGGARVRRLLVLLLLAPGRTVSADRLAAGVWDGAPPANPANALQALVSRLRRQLGRAGAVQGGPAGYLISAAPADVDLWEFEALVQRGRAARAAGEAAAAVQLFSDALRLWRGDPLPELAGGDSEAVRVAEQYRGAEVELLEARLEAGEHAAAVPALEELAAREPLREHVTELLMRALAATGRTAEALVAYERLRARLAEALGADPGRAVAALHVELLRGGGPAHRPEPAPGRPEAPPARLPTRLTSFVAREAELDRALQLLPEQRLVTLVGPGGAGKTRLAVEAGARIADGTSPGRTAAAGAVPGPAAAAGVPASPFPDGVWFVDLAPLRDDSAVAITLLDVLGLRERTVAPMPAAGSADPVERAAELIGGRRVLLIADNCEHLLPGLADALERLLRRCRGLHVAATSREPLGVPGERLLPVPPLAPPPEDATPGQAAENAAVRLFADRVRAHDPGFAIDAATTGPVVRICRELDGMPLALELAAARVRHLPLPRLAERLSDRFRLLAGGPATADGRHRTLEAVVDWSWELLDGAERALLRRMAAFSAGAGLDAVEEVCSDTGAAAAPDAPGGTGSGSGASAAAGSGTVGGRDVWDVLFSLVDKSLVTVEGTAEPDGPRYRLLETVRAYGRQRLAESGETDGVRAAQARFLLRLLPASAEALLGPDQGSVIRRLRAAEEEHSAVLAWAIGTGRLPLAFDLTAAALPYAQLDRGWADLPRHAADLLQAAGSTPPAGRAAAYAQCIALCTLDRDLHPPQAGRAGTDRAAAELDRAEAVLRAAGERAEDHLSLLFVAVLLGLLGHDPEGALRRAQAAARALPGGQALVAEGFAGMLLEQAFLGRCGEARAALLSVLDRLSGIGERWTRTTVAFLASELVGLDDTAAEAALLDEAIADGEAMGMAETVDALYGLRAVALARSGDAAAGLAALDGRTGGGAGEYDLRLLTHLCRAQILRWAGEGQAARAELDALVGGSADAGDLLRTQLTAPLRSEAARLAAGRGSTAAARGHVAAAWASLQGTRKGAASAKIAEAAADVEAAAGAPLRAAEALRIAEALRGLPAPADPDVAALLRRLDAVPGADAARKQAAGRPPEDAWQRFDARVRTWGSAEDEGADTGPGRY